MALLTTSSNICSSWSWLVKLSTEISIREQPKILFRCIPRLRYGNLERVQFFHHSSADSQLTSRAFLLKKLGKKRKFNQAGPPFVMYGIVTTALSWRFLRWTGSFDKPNIRIS